MGTRADFYAGDISNPQSWLGSIGWNGHPEDMPITLINATTEDEFRQAVAELFEVHTDGALLEERENAFTAIRDSSAIPSRALTDEVIESCRKSDVSRGEWVWPWPTSSGTDFTYAFVEGKVRFCSFGRGWFSFDKTAYRAEADTLPLQGFCLMPVPKSPVFDARSGAIAMEIKEP